MSGQAGVSKSVAADDGQAGQSPPTAFGFAVPGGGAVQAPTQGQAGGGQPGQFAGTVAIDLSPAGEFDPLGQPGQAGQSPTPTPQPAAPSPTPTPPGPEPVHAVLPAIGAVLAKPGGSAGPGGSGEAVVAGPVGAGGTAVPAASPGGQAAAPPTVPPGQWAPPAAGPVGNQVSPDDAGQVLVKTGSARAAAGDAGRRVRSQSRPRVFVSARGQALGPGPSAAPGGDGGQAPPPRDGQSDADPPRVVAPGGAAWADRLAQAGAPVGQSMGWREFERSVQDAAMAIGQSVPICPGPAVEAGTAEDLVRPRSVWTLRDHIGQLQRELGQVDALLVAGWFGQMDSPPLRRGLITAAGNLLPVLQAHRLKLFCLFWRSRHRPD